MDKWLEGQELKDDVVISSRLRVARNLENMKFPQNMTMEESQLVTDKVLNAFKQSKGLENKNYRFYRINDLMPLQRQVFIEKHLISPNMIEKPEKSSFLLREDERVSVMLNEEDHIRIQVLYPGLNLDEGWKMCSLIDDEIENYVDYAFDEKFGYITSCPTNVGTGLRASVMVHLPCLAITGYINNIVQALRQIGLTIRGLYGEGTEAVGNVFQISNQVTLGETEEEIIQKLNTVLLQIIEKERDIRKNLLNERKVEIEDRIFRSYGILKYARSISSSEAMGLFSNVKMGVEMGIIDDKISQKINSLMMLIQPGNLQEYYNADLTPEERDIKRADMIREKFN